LTFDLQNLIRSSVGANEYSLSVLTQLFKEFMRYDKRSSECILGGVAATGLRCGVEKRSAATRPEP